jgi:hypothetical protein
MSKFQSDQASVHTAGVHKHCYTNDNELLQLLLLLLLLLLLPPPPLPCYYYYYHHFCNSVTRCLSPYLATFQANSLTHPVSCTPRSRCPFPQGRHCDLPADHDDYRQHQLACLNWSRWRNSEQNEGGGDPVCHASMAKW